MLSMSRLEGFLVGMVAIYLVWRIVRICLDGRASATARAWIRELMVLALSLALFLGFLILGAVWHRPMLSLAGVPQNQLVVDFHSHTNLSHDVKNTWMRGFDAEANRRWHERAGFDVAFVTDHNVTSHQSPVVSRGL